MRSAECGMRSAEIAGRTSNIQHPTSNTQPHGSRITFHVSRFILLSPGPGLLRLRPDEQAHAGPAAIPAAVAGFLALAAYSTLRSQRSKRTFPGFGSGEASIPGFVSGFDRGDDPSLRIAGRLAQHRRAVAVRPAGECAGCLRALPAEAGLAGGFE